MLELNSPMQRAATATQPLRDLRLGLFGLVRWSMK